MLEDCVRYLVERCNLLPGQLGVITPYAAQVALLSKRLQKRGFNINGSGSSGSWDSQDGECFICPEQACRTPIVGLPATMACVDEAKHSLTAHAATLHICGDPTEGQCPVVTQVHVP